MNKKKTQVWINQIQKIHYPVEAPILFKNSIERYCVARNSFLSKKKIRSKIIDIMLSVIYFSSGIVCLISYAFVFAEGI